MLPIYINIVVENEEDVDKILHQVQSAVQSAFNEVKVDGVDMDVDIGDWEYEESDNKG